MKSSQINFYFTIEDVKQIDQFIKENSFIILSQPMKTKDLNIVPSLLVEESNSRSDKLITSSKFIDKIFLKYIDTQKYYLVDVAQSPVIEFFNPNNLDNKKLRGRLYYTKTFLTEQKKLMAKDTDFLTFSENFFKWIKKNFKNEKYKGYESFLVTKNTIDWIEKTNGKLLVNNIIT